MKLNLLWETRPQTNYNLLYDLLIQIDSLFNYTRNIAIDYRQKDDNTSTDQLAFHEWTRITEDNESYPLGTYIVKTQEQEIISQPGGFASYYFITQSEDSLIATWNRNSEELYGTEYKTSLDLSPTRFFVGGVNNKYGQTGWSIRGENIVGYNEDGTTRKWTNTNNPPMYLNVYNGEEIIFDTILKVEFAPNHFPNYTITTKQPITKLPNTDIMVELY